MDGGLFWLAAVNLVLWAGLFFYLRRLDGQLRDLETRTDRLPERDR